MLKKLLVLALITFPAVSLAQTQTASDSVVYLTPAVSETIENSSPDNSALINQLYRMIAELQAKIRILTQQKNEVRPLTATSTTSISVRTRQTSPAPAPQPVQPNQPAPPAQPITPVPVPTPTPTPVVPAISSFSPTNGSIDARNPNGSFMSVNMGTLITPTTENYPTSDFSVSTSRGDLPLSLNNLSYNGNSKTITPSFSRQILNGERIRLTHKPSGSSACYGYLPGDVDGSGTVAPADHLAIIDAVNGTRTLSNSSTDINRSGDTNPADILAFIDGFNSGWLGTSLPTCPSPISLTPTQIQLANILFSLRSILTSFGALSGH